MKTNTSPKNTKKAFLFSIIGSIVYLLGIGSIVFFSRPENVHRTYISENALMPGSANAEYSASDLSRAAKLTSEEIQLRNATPEIRIQKLADLMISLGLETTIHNYTTLNGEKGYNLYSIARAYKSNGVEATVLSTTYNDGPARKNNENDVNGFGFMASMMRFLSTRKWLSKDVLFVATDAQHGDEGINQWLHTYLYDASTVGFPRGGAIQASLNLKLAPTSKFDQLAILIDGPNGQLPNLDLVNTIQRVSRREGVPESEIVLSKPGSSLIWPQFPTIRDATYVRYATPQLRTLLTFMLNQAYGVPTGNHGLFNRYTIDSVTLTEIHDGGSQIISVHSLGRIVEGTMRSINNLLEHLHQSFYYYLLPSSTLYISIGEYMISFGLVMFGYTIRNALAVLALPYDSHVTRSLLVVTAFAIAGISLFSLPHTIEVVAPYAEVGLTGSQVMMAWSMIAAVLTFLIYFVATPLIEMQFVVPNAPDTFAIRASAFKTLASIAPIVFLAAASLQNFSFAFFAAVLFIPLYATIFPAKNIVLNLAQRLLLVVTSPPVVLYGISVWLMKNPFEILAMAVEHYQSYSTLFFPFLCLVYIPTHCVLFKLLNVA